MRILGSMGVVSLLCPNCAGSIEFDENKEFGFCMHCGQKVMIQEKIKQRVVIDNTQSIGAWIALAESANVSGNHEAIEKYVDKVLEVDLNNFHAWLLKGSAASIARRPAEAVYAWNKAISLINTKEDAIKCDNIITLGMCKVFDTGLTGVNLQVLGEYDGLNQDFSKWRINPANSIDLLVSELIRKYEKIADLTELIFAFEVICIIQYMISMDVDPRNMLRRFEKAIRFCQTTRYRSRSMQVIPEEEGYFDRKGAETAIDRFEEVFYVLHSALNERFSRLTEIDIERIQNYWFDHYKELESLTENLAGACVEFSDGQDRVFGGKLKASAKMKMTSFANKFVSPMYSKDR